MSELRGRRAQRVPLKPIQPIAAKVAAAGSSLEREKRRGIRVNSRVPISIEWAAAGQQIRKETQTRVVGPYGCLVLLSQDLQPHQELHLTNLVSQASNAARVVWRGAERPEGWELGIELINPQMDFWGLDL